MNKKLNKFKNLQSSSGQTILEVVISLTLIILFLSGVVIIELFAIRNVQYSQNKSIATRLARQQLERAKVVRDTAGITALTDNCEVSSCYINPTLTPVLINLVPTGVYNQSLRIQSSSDCPMPDITITPFPQFYKATSTVTWSDNVSLTPPAQVILSTCITDWK